MNAAVSIVRRQIFKHCKDCNINSMKTEILAPSRLHCQQQKCTDLNTTKVEISTEGRQRFEHCQGCNVNSMKTEISTSRRLQCLQQKDIILNSEKAAMSTA